MGAQDRDYMKAPVAEAPEAAPAGFQRPAWLDRLNEIGEKNATAIISVSTALIILIVLIFAKHYYDKAQLERADQDLAIAESVEQLTELKTKYGATPVAPRILFKLANKHNENGKLEAARNEYREFQARFPGDPLGKHVTRALGALEKNLKFESEGKEARLRDIRLLPHPARMADARDPRLAWGPVASIQPMAEIDLPGGTVRVELLEDAAPNAVALFVKLAEAKHFDGVKIESVVDGRIQTAAKAPAAGDFTIAAEDSRRPGEAGLLALVRKEGAAENVAGRFIILTQGSSDLKDATVFGVVAEGLPVAGALKKDDVIKAVRISAKRDHAYEPKPLK